MDMADDCVLLPGAPVVRAMRWIFVSADLMQKSNATKASAVPAAPAVLFAPTASIVVPASVANVSGISETSQVGPTCERLA
jgi:hypothetical protein